MKNKCALLLKIQLLQTLPLNRLRYSPIPRSAAGRSSWGVSVGLVGLVLIFYSLLFATGCVMVGLSSVIPPLVITASSLADAGHHPDQEQRPAVWLQGL